MTNHSRNNVLEVLRIKNLAVIDAAEIPFRSGLNILSGETGAGKSIILEAISLLLGSRASAELVRSGCDEAIIEGIFDLTHLSWVAKRLETLGFRESTTELLIKRTVNRNGKHRISVNGELATLHTLQKLCEGLIDLCSQNEHQTLLRPSTQLELLDRYGGLIERSKHVSQLWVAMKTLLKEKEALEKLEMERAVRADFLKFQMDEIKTADLQPQEDEGLLQEKLLLQSAEARAQHAESIRCILEADDGGILCNFRPLIQKFKLLSNLDESTATMLVRAENAFLEMEDLSLQMNRYLNSIDLPSERLIEVQDRLSLIADLKRKYGSTLDGILEYLSQIEAEFQSLDRNTERLSQIDAELIQIKGDLLKKGKALSQSRKSVAQTLQATVTQELQDLKMGDAELVIELTEKDHLDQWSSSGADSIQFLVQTNAGEPARPIGKIASGGELSRLMLAVRRVISNKGGIGVYLFDEIDAGIGGQTAFEVGKKLRSVAQHNQVICITHLPQVASFADHHLVVAKLNRKNRTLTEVITLDSGERQKELARMLGGPKLTPKSLENASELLEMASHIL